MGPYDPLQIVGAITFLREEIAIGNPLDFL